MAAPNCRVAAALSRQDDRLQRDIAELQIPKPFGECFDRLDAMRCDLVATSFAAVGW